MILQGTARAACGVDGGGMGGGYSGRDASYLALHTSFAHIFMNRRTGDVPVCVDRYDRVDGCGLGRDAF
jgi:hypothetical protein